jgi:hypothetical protein
VNTVARIVGVKKVGPPSWAFEFPGGKVAGTMDAAIGQPLADAYAADPEHCVVELELEERGTRLWIVAGNYINAPEELGGPTETPTGAAATAEEPPAADLSLDELVNIHDRLLALEEWARSQGFGK